MDLLLNDLSLNKTDKEIKEEKKREKSDSCQELKNIAYRTMLLNGTDINPVYDDLNNNTKITSFLETESKANKLETWAKLDKTQKIIRLNAYALILKDKYNLTSLETENLNKYFIRCLDRRNLYKSKEVIYNKEKNYIENIPYLIFNEDTRSFILKKDDKHVSTVKSLPDKKNKVKTIKIHE